MSNVPGKGATYRESESDHSYNTVWARWDICHFGKRPAVKLEGVIFQEDNVAHRDVGLWSGPLLSGLQRLP